ncbi:hypothetical protein L3X38_022165 [Prunus dulcis]|uniref:Uncharacterized protein n=1 Tax=Prunus dulcis TaxID=3755 RepID=A0AAD4VWP5_PRUDU|nr:hypothetical protein L3X38_022165 [Prunus dulcis]
MVEKSYLRRRKWWPEEREIGGEESGKIDDPRRQSGDGWEAAEVTAGRWLRYERRERAEAEAAAERDSKRRRKTRNGEEGDSGRFCRFIRLCATKNNIRRAK